MFTEGLKVPSLILPSWSVLNALKRIYLGKIFAQDHAEKQLFSIFGFLALAEGFCLLQQIIILETLNPSPGSVNILSKGPCMSFLLLLTNSSNRKLTNSAATVTHKLGGLM